MKLIPVKYHNKDYPDVVIPQLIEVAGNIDSEQLEVNVPYSLHTEYSYLKRTFASQLLDGLEELKKAQIDGIPQLWKNTAWSEEYAVFIERLIGTSLSPEVIEIHPPFKDYCMDFETFWERFTAFYRYIHNKFPAAKILIENRCGTMYSKSPFLLSSCSDMLKFCQFLSDKNSELGVIVDYPQLFSAEKIKMDNVKIDKILAFNNSLKSYADIIGAIHLWGKRKSKKSDRWSPHSGDLNTFFSFDEDKKSAFLESIKDTFYDEKERYFIPEVNTSEMDLQSIINDLIKYNFEFVQRKSYEQLIAIEWDSSLPEFILYNQSEKTIRRLSAIGKFSISVGEKKYCIGNKDIVSHQYIGCPMNAEISDNHKKCFLCDKNDVLKYCVRCNGQSCFADDDSAINRCNQTHYVYLAYFPDDIVKVGIAHHTRKYIRLYEQGALYAIIIASCDTGKHARQLEHRIKQLGVRDKVLTNQKIHNLVYFDKSHAHEQLMSTRKKAIERLNELTRIGINILDDPEIVTQEDTLLLLKNFESPKTQQISFWDLFDNSVENHIATHILEDINGFQGEIISFVGHVAIMTKNNEYFLFDFNKVIGREINIIADYK